MWEILGQRLTRGEKRRAEIQAAPGYIMPATLISGAKAGQTLLITAGIHSGEYPGIAAVARLAELIDPALLTGNLILIHCVNVGGFWQKTNGIVPEDGANLNGNYPGRADGSPGERIADFFVREIFPHVDFVLDMHSGGLTEPLTPCLFFPRADAVRAESLAAARAMDIPLLVESTAEAGEYSYAAVHMRIPGLLVERGHSGQCRAKWVDEYLRDLRLLLKHRRMYGFSGTTVQSKKIYTRAIYLTSTASGLWHPAVREGQRLGKGELLGTISNFYGEELARFKAEYDGVVLYYSAGLSMRMGDPLVAYALEHYEE